MTNDERAELSLRLSQIIDDYEDKPTWYIAEKIIQLCLSEEIEKIKNQYERLFYTDISNKN